MSPAIAAIILVLYNTSGKYDAQAITLPQPDMETCESNGKVFTNPPNAHWYNNTETLPFENYKCIDPNKKYPEGFQW